MPVHARGPLGLADAAHRYFDTVLMGRGTSEPALAAGVTSPYPHLRQLVISRSLAGDDPDVEVVAGDPLALVRDLKQADGMGSWLAGGGQLAAHLRGEIDELVIKRNPVVIGGGVPLFNGPFRPTPFELVGTRSFGTGVVVETYRRGE